MRRNRKTEDGIDDLDNLSCYCDKMEEDETVYPAFLWSDSEKFQNSMYQPNLFWITGCVWLRFSYCSRENI